MHAGEVVEALYHRRRRDLSRTCIRRLERAEPLFIAARARRQLVGRRAHLRSELRQLLGRRARARGVLVLDLRATRVVRKSAQVRLLVFCYGLVESFAYFWAGTTPHLPHFVPRGGARAIII